jgi:hypothetical protein
VERLRELCPYVCLLQHHQIVRIMTKSFIHPKAEYNQDQLASLLALVSYCPMITANHEAVDENSIAVIHNIQQQLLAARQLTRDLLVKVSGHSKTSYDD